MTKASWGLKSVLHINISYFQIVGSGKVTVFTRENTVRTVVVFLNLVSKKVRG